MTRDRERTSQAPAARAGGAWPARAPDADAALFRAAVGDVRPLPARPAGPQRPRPAARARFRRADEERVLAESLAPAAGEPFLETGDELLFQRAQPPGRTLERLRRGEFRVEDEIDLHGMNALEARTAVRDFLADALRRGLRCVRIVHGKGLRSGARGPVLKHAVNTWLRRFEAVIAFASARRVDGGTGAVYVLLARR